MLDLFMPGVYLRCPGGNVETASNTARAARWVACNIGGDPCVNRDPNVWATVNARHAQAGIPTFPWLHCRTLKDIDALVASGHGWFGSTAPAIGLNLEDVQRDFTEKGISLGDVAQRVSGWTGPIHIATLPWIQNGQGWSALDQAVFALEIMADEQRNTFPTGKPDPVVVDQCIEHAFMEGCEKVTLMLKTKGFTPADYGRQFAVCHSLFTGDDIEPTPSGWQAWAQAQPCTRLEKEDPVPSTPPTKKQLSEKVYPYTGPQYGPSSPKGPTKNSSTVKGVKRGMMRLGLLGGKLGTETDDFGPALESALTTFQRQRGITPAGQYGRNTWLALRSAAVPAELPHEGEYAMDARALALVREDTLTLCYPHPQGATSGVCQGLHITAGLTGNWAIDFCAPGGTKVVAVERATIVKLSGRNPSEGAQQDIGIFGWSIHYETANGYHYFSTHYGSRSYHVGQIVDPGDVLGTVGSWPGDPGRSHTHLGVTSPLGSADAKRKITAVAQAQRVAV